MKKKDDPHMYPYHIRYRPTQLRDVIGQPAAVRSLKELLKDRTAPHSYLFTGPSGVGKTTLARILAPGIGINSRNVLEIDAATNAGIDAMRSLKTQVETPSFGANPKRLLIIDECHSLSKQAWQSWLKIIEEPPEHLYIAFCTTEVYKVPKTIKTRCVTFDLKPVAIKEIENLLDVICYAEQLKPPAGSCRIIAGKADGSVRQALVYLSVIAGCKNKKQVLQALEQEDLGGEAVMLLCKTLISGSEFKEVKNIVAKIDADGMEGVRIAIINYAAKVLLTTKSSKKEMYMLAILDEFSEPFRDYERKAPLLLALGRLLKDG